MDALPAIQTMLKSNEHAIALNNLILRKQWK